MMSRGVGTGEARQDGVLVTGGVPAPKGSAGRMATGKKDRIRRSARMGSVVCAEKALGLIKGQVKVVAGWSRLTERGGIRSETGATGGLEAEMLSTGRREDKVNNADQGIDVSLERESASSVLLIQHEERVLDEGQMRVDRGLKSRADSRVHKTTLSVNNTRGRRDNGGTRGERGRQSNTGDQSFMVSIRKMRVHGNRTGMQEVKGVGSEEDIIDDSTGDTH